MGVEVVIGVVMVGGGGNGDKVVTIGDGGDDR